MAILHRRAFAARVELLGRVLADRLQHPEAHVAVRLVLLAQQAPGDQRPHAIQGCES